MKEASSRDQRMISTLVVGIVTIVLTSLLPLAAAFSSSAVPQSPPDPLVAVFSDVDGTLVHYPRGDDRLLLERKDDDATVLRLPPSATGLQGVISAQTLANCQELRGSDTKLVLVSGMRTSTLLARLPFLPLADAYCAEGGGRIFYRVPLSDEEGQGPSLEVHPQPYDGATPEDQQPFTLREDETWRQKMEALAAAGTDGYRGVELDHNDPTTTKPLQDRAGALWKYAQELSSQGLVLDTKGYATCFRVNRKQQQKSAQDPQTFAQTLQAVTSKCPQGISTSTNLGCVDFYPSDSGKRNCCQYLAIKFCQDHPDVDREDALSEHCVCLCDDDNDSEMAMAVQHAFVPGVGSKSMKALLKRRPEHFSRTGEDHQTILEGMVATERALELVLELATTCETRTLVDADVCLLNIDDARDALKFY